MFSRFSHANIHNFFVHFPIRNWHQPFYNRSRSDKNYAFSKNTVPTRVTHCAFIALQKFHSDHCLKHFCQFPNNISFSFLNQKTNPHNLQQSSSHCGSIALRTNCEVAFWFGAIARKGVCTVISRSFARSVDIVAWPVQRRFSFCTS